MFSRGLYQRIAVRLDQRRSRVLLLSLSIGIVVLCVFCIMDTCSSCAILFTFLLILGTTLWIKSNDKKEKESLPTKPREMLNAEIGLETRTAFFPYYLDQKQKLQIESARRAAVDTGMKHLRNMFEEVEQFLKMKEFDKELQDELSASCPNYMKVLLTAKRDLLRSDCGIVITGATSAGKTTLVNLIIGKEKEKLFVSSNLASTGTVCRIRNSQKMELKVFSKDEVLQKEVTVDDIKQLKSTIKRFTDISQLQDEIPDAYFVDVYLPVSILKGNVIIVDTPGIGETENLDKILMDFLPHAVSFVFVINARDAGGIHEGRLLKILKTIIENRDKMPCFDPMDVMFLTNQWDIVENDYEEDEEVTGQDKTWKDIKYKLEKGWACITPDNLFRVSLKQVAAQMKTEFTEDYERFTQVLKDTIDKNQNKRMKFYYSFLQTFTRNAERGTLARLKLLERSEDEQHRIVMKTRENIKTLTVQCSQARILLVDYKTEVVSKLADKLRNYVLSSDGKDKILNPDGATRIKNVSYRLLNEEIPRRVEIGIKRWCEGIIVKEIMAEANAKIQSLLKDIEGKLQNIETDVAGIHLYLRDDTSDFALFGFFVLSPWAIVVAFVFGIILVPVVAIWALISSSAWHESKVNELYEKCLESLNRQALVESFEKSFGADYNKVIVRIFDDTLPVKLSGLEKLNEKLLTDHKKIIEKRKSFERLKNKMESLRKETDLFRKTCARLFET